MRAAADAGLDRGSGQLTISVQMWKKDNWYIAKCAELDSVSQGGDPEEARRNLLEVVEIQLEEMTELGTLDEYLSECGYVHEGGAIVPHTERVGFEKQSVQVLAREVPARHASTTAPVCWISASSRNSRMRSISSESEWLSAPSYGRMNRISARTRCTWTPSRLPVLRRDPVVGPEQPGVLWCRPRPSPCVAPPTTYEALATGDELLTTLRDSLLEQSVPASAVELLSELWIRGVIEEVERVESLREISGVRKISGASDLLGLARAGWQGAGRHACAAWRPLGRPSGVQGGAWGLSRGLAGLCGIPRERGRGCLYWTTGTGRTEAMHDSPAVAPDRPDPGRTEHAEPPEEGPAFKPTSRHRTVTQITAPKGRKFHLDKQLKRFYFGPLRS